MTSTTWTPALVGLEGWYAIDPATVPSLARTDLDGRVTTCDVSRARQFATREACAAWCEAVPTALNKYEPREVKVPRARAL